MARKQNKLERFTRDCMDATPEQLDGMLDILKGVRGKRQPAKPRLRHTQAQTPKTKLTSTQES